MPLAQHWNVMGLGADMSDHFIQGAACALAIVNRNHDVPTMCAEALAAIGPTTAEELRAAGVDEYDIEGLESVLRHLARAAK